MNEAVPAYLFVVFDGSEFPFVRLNLCGSGRMMTAPRGCCPSSLRILFPA
jgi:hypothetical protein